MLFENLQIFLQIFTTNMFYILCINFIRLYFLKLTSFLPFKSNQKLSILCINFIRHCYLKNLKIVNQVSTLLDAAAQKFSNIYNSFIRFYCFKIHKYSYKFNQTLILRNTQLPLLTLWGSAAWKFTNIPTNFIKLCCLETIDCYINFIRLGFKNKNPESKTSILVDSAAQKFTNISNFLIRLCC